MPPFNDKQRYLAMRRAVRLNKLFKETHFDAIMTALYKPDDDPTRESDFYDACGNAGLDAAEKDWLWNYLKHCNKSEFGGWNPVREAHQAEEPAQTGW
jgi:hypothetical protein